MKWSSSKTTARDGFHDAALVEFTSKVSVIEVLVRELIQNSLDALDDIHDPVKIIFEPGEVDVNEIPDWSTLKSIFESSKKYNQKAWPGAFKIMSKHFSSKRMNILKLTDLNTIGLSKKQHGDEVSSWEACVLADSQSVKANNGSRGSFGIGKNAAFALSEINTVLYDTVSIDGAYFGGVSKLGGHTINEHNYSSKKIIQGLGGRTPFAHPTNEHGLTQTILGISNRNFKDLKILLELYLYKHYLTAFFNQSLAAEIKGIDASGNNLSISIQCEDQAEFISFINERLNVISPYLKLKSQKADIEHIQLVANALQRTVTLEPLYDEIKGKQVFLDYLGLEELPNSWEYFFKNTRLNFFHDSSIARNTIFHYRNGMFIFSKSFANSFSTPISIVHDVSTELSDLYSRFETFSHDKWLKNLLKDRLSSKDEIQKHEQLFDFQRLMPKFFLIYLAGDSIKEGNSQLERLVNNILSGESNRLANSDDNGLVGSPENGELIKTSLVINGIEQGRKGASRGTKGRGSGTDSGKGSGGTRSPKTKINRPIISNVIQHNSTTYKFRFSNLSEGNYSFNRQGLVQTAELNFIKITSHDQVEAVVVGDKLNLNVLSAGKIEFEIQVADTTLTQWKILKQ